MKMKISLNRLRTSLSLARQWAITHRCNTCFVFFGPQIGNAYCIHCKKHGFIKGWKKLPKGVKFDETSSPTMNPLCLEEKGEFDRHSGYYIKFNALGGLASGATPRGIYLGYENASKDSNIATSLTINGLTGLIKR